MFQSHDYLPYNKIDNNIKGPNRIIINSSEIIYFFFYQTISKSRPIKFASSLQDDVFH